MINRTPAREGPDALRDVETELRRGYLGTANRKERQQTNRAYGHRATSRLYRSETVNP
jgi:hypothetical protein